MWTLCSSHTMLFIPAYIPGFIPTAMTSHHTWKPDTSLSSCYNEPIVQLSFCHSECPPPLSILTYSYPVQKVCGSHGYTTVSQISGKNQIRGVTTFIDRKTRSSKRKTKISSKRTTTPESFRNRKLSSEAALVRESQKAEETLSRQKEVRERSKTFSSRYF